jgi:hypothetical protein
VPVSCIPASAAYIETYACHLHDTATTASLTTLHVHTTALHGRSEYTCGVARWSKSPDQTWQVQRVRDYHQYRSAHMPLNSDHLRKSHQKGHMQVDHISCYAHRFHERMSYSGKTKPCGEGSCLQDYCAFCINDIPLSFAL